MNIALWIAQVLLAVLCIAGGAYQIFKLDELRPEVRAMRELPKALWTLLGAVGCMAGLGLIVPGVTGLLPSLTAIAAAVVVVHSLLISGFYLRYQDRSPLPFSLTMVMLAAFIWYGRLQLTPL